MRCLIFLLVLGTGIISTVSSGQEWRIDLLEPKGFRFFLQSKNGITSASINGAIFEEPYGDDPKALYEGVFNTTNDGWWVYQNLTAALNPGDRTIFAIQNDFDPSADSSELDDAILNFYTVPDNVTRVAV